ncbi:MAG: hypothetical protein AAGA71_03790 [Pseudomonadota bacterium]
MEFALLSVLVGLGLTVSLLGGGDGDDDAPAANAGDDVITGTDGPDRIEAGAGDDIVNALGGNDQLFLGIGSDEANAGEGDDTVFAGGGSDIVTGGPGNDEVFLDDGPDRSIGADLMGVPQDGGNDTINGGGGNDEILDRFGTNTLRGNEGADILNAVDNPGDGTPDRLFGGFGSDTLIGDDGDTLTGDGDPMNTQVDTFEGRFDELGEDNIILTDFDPATETLTLTFDSGTFAALDNSDLTFSQDGVTGDVQLFVDGTLVAILEGQTPGFTPTGITVQTV